MCGAVLQFQDVDALHAPAVDHLDGYLPALAHLEGQRVHAFVFVHEAYGRGVEAGLAAVVVLFYLKGCSDFAGSLGHGKAGLEFMRLWACRS